MVMYNGGVYEIRNIINDKVYVGSTNNFEKRFNEHIKSLNNENLYTNPFLQKEWNKYGQNNFVFTILEYCGEDEKIEREIYYINKYDCFNNKLIGYNLKMAGPSGLQGPMSEDHKRKLSEAKKGKSFSDTHKQNISKSRLEKGTGKGANNGMYGKNHSEESRSKMGRPGRIGKRVLTLDDCKNIIKLRETMKPMDIAKMYNISSGPIYRILSGNHWSCKEMEDV